MPKDRDYTITISCNIAILCNTIKYNAIHYMQHHKIPICWSIGYFSSIVISCLLLWGNHEIVNTSRTSKPKLAANLDKLSPHQSFLKAPEKISSRFSTPSQNLYTCFIKLRMCSHNSNETSQEWPSEWHCHVISCPQTVSGVQTLES